MNSGSHSFVMSKLPPNGIIGTVKIRRFLRPSLEAIAFRLGPRVFAISKGTLLGIISDPNPVAGGTYSISVTKPSGPLRDSAIEAYNRFRHEKTDRKPDSEGPIR